MGRKRELSSDPWAVWSREHKRRSLREAHQILKADAAEWPLLEAWRVAKYKRNRQSVIRASLQTWRRG
jgi:hypothetical protein